MTGRATMKSKLWAGVALVSMSAAATVGSSARQ